MIRTVTMLLLGTVCALGSRFTPVMPEPLAFSAVCRATLSSYGTVLCKGVILDADGAQLQSIDELTGSERLYRDSEAILQGIDPRYEQYEHEPSVSSAPDPDTPTVDVPFYVVDMEHHKHKFHIRPGESLDQFARRVCEWNDLCLLRKWTWKRMRRSIIKIAKWSQSNQDWHLTKPQAEIQIPFIALGRVPKAHKRDLSHLDVECVSCAHSYAPSHKSGMRHPHGDPKSSHPTVGNRIHLMIDEHLIHEKHNVELQYAKGDKLNRGLPILTRNRPWEGSPGFLASGYHTVIFDETRQRFRLWYHCWWTAVSVH